MMHSPFKEKREMDRMPVNEEVFIFHKNMVYSGTVLNLSENGMLIGTKKYFPLASRIAISFPNSNDFMKLSANIKWAATVNELIDGVGVELSDPPKAYLGFIDTFKTL